MANRRSAGLLLFRRPSAPGIEVLIAHMGGPFWVNKDKGAWSIPKGEYELGEEPLTAACREFEEELGRAAPTGEFIDLGEVAQPGGKLVRAWALEADVDVSKITSNSFEMEWPPRSGRLQQFPEIDRAGWFDLDTARTKLVKGQVRFVDLLSARLGLEA